MAKKEVVNIDELDYGDKFVGQNSGSAYYSALFGTPANGDSERFEFRKVLRTDLHKFPNHPFRVIVNDEMYDLRDSIIANGILQPPLVTPNSRGGYTILSGHRRCKAAELAKISEIPVLIIRGISDDQATIIMVDSNKQREHTLPSEKAYAYKMKLEAMKRQAGRPSKENSSPVGINFRGKQSLDIMGEKSGDSRNQIHRYIRLTYLIPQLLDLVDNSVTKEGLGMAFRPAVEISYLTQTEQHYFYETVKILGKVPSVQQAMQIKDISRLGELTQSKVMEILVADKPNQKETAKIDCSKLRDYYGASLSPKEYEAKVFESLNSLKKIRAAIEKHMPTSLTDDEMVTLTENLLKDYIKKSTPKRKEFVR